MRILHYISELKTDDLITSYVSELLSTMRDMAEVAILTQKENAEKRIKEFKPDILHVHACWNHEAANVASLAAKQGVAVVISPHGGLMPYTMRYEQPTEKYLKRLAFQKTMMVKAEGVLVFSQEEADGVKELGWQSRISIVPSALYDSSITPKRMAQEISRFYTKIIDTRYRRLMTAVEKEAVCSLLRAGCHKNDNEPLLTGEKVRTLRTLNREQWQRILLLCEDEDIRDIADKTVNTLLIQFPNINVKEIERFPTPLKKSKGNLEADKLLSNDDSIKRQLGNIAKSDSLLGRFFTLLLNAKYHHENATLSLRHLANIYQVFRFEDYDEDEFEYIAKKLSIYKWTGRVLQLMVVFFQLGEGFMPQSPLNDATTKNIIKTMGLWG